MLEKKYTIKRICFEDSRKAYGQKNKEVCLNADEPWGRQT